MRRTSWSSKLQLTGAMAVCTTLILWTLLGRDPIGCTHVASTGQDLHADSIPKVKVGWVGGNAIFERPPSGLTLREALPIASDNSGNLVWSYAAYKLLDPNATEMIFMDQSLNPPFKHPVDVVMMPTANMLMDNRSRYYGAGVEQSSQFSLRVAETVTAPIMLIGIGTQVFFGDIQGQAVPNGTQAGADYSVAKLVTLSKTQVDFLKLVQASGGYIAARGEFTATAITANGVAPPLPLGCPSFLLNHNPHLGTVLQQKLDALLQQRDPNLRIAITLPFTPGDKPLPTDLLKVLAERIFKRFPNSVAVLQTDADGGTLDAMHRIADLYLKEGRVRHFYDVQSWVDGLRSCCDLVFGFRIHGTMAGVIAEVPSVIVSTDFRVKELADSMTLPSVDMLEAKFDAQNFDIFDFLKSVRGYQGFDARRREVAQVYIREFHRLKVPIHPGIVQLANTPGNR